MSLERRDARAKETGAPRSRQRALLVPTLVGTQFPGGPSLQLRGESARRPVLSRVRSWLCQPPSAVRGESGWPRRAPCPASPHLRSRRAPGDSGSAGSGCRLARRAQRGAPRAARAHRGLGGTSASYLMASSPPDGIQRRCPSPPGRSAGPPWPAGSGAARAGRLASLTSLPSGRKSSGKYRPAGRREPFGRGHRGGAAKWIRCQLGRPVGFWSLKGTSWQPLAGGMETHQPDREVPSPI